MSLTQSILRSPAVAALTSPHGVDRYLEVVNPMWAVNEVRAQIVQVHRETPDVTTVTLRPTSTWRGFRAGQYVQVGVEIAGARRTRCFSISSPETEQDTVAITVRGRDEGMVSKYLAREAASGLVLHLSQADGEFTLPQRPPRRLLMISGGSGITPLMSMLRTLVDQEYAGRVTFLHYNQSPEHTIFRDELAALAQHASIDLHVVHTRAGGTRFTHDQLAALVPDYAETDAFACGPAGLVEQIREGYADNDRLKVEYFKTSTISTDGPAEGSISFTMAGQEAANSGATLLEQAEALGLRPEYGCRMGICRTCTTRKHEGRCATSSPGTSPRFLTRTSRSA